MAASMNYPLNKLLTFLFFVIVSAGNAQAKLTCMEKSGKPIQIGIAFGYIDQIPNDRVLDGLFFSRLQNLLTQECTPEEESICGFSTTSRNPLTFKKDKITITMFNSSVSASNQYNVQNPEQATKSELATGLIKSMANESDIIFYLGHSRKGGGPDFTPPLLTNDNKVDYEYYKTNRPGLNLLNDILPGSNVKVFGIYSCDSLNNFSAYLRNNLPDVDFIFTDKATTPSDAFKVMTSDLRKVISNQCMKTF
jgi:hypothetical protein